MNQITLRDRPVSFKVCDLNRFTLCAFILIRVFYFIISPIEDGLK